MAPTARIVGGTGERDLDEAIFGAEVKPHLVHEAVRAELNANRAGTFATKSRGLVSGGRSKPWRQKGTGRARQGTIRAPQFEGGGHAFAKTPRTFTQKVNRKVVKAAFRSALASHAQAGTVAVLDPSAFTEPSTKHADGTRADRGRRRGGQVVPQPRGHRDRRTRRARDQRDRLGPLAARQRGRPAARRNEG
jgi:large subunit ribosomal protein L4